MKSKIKMLLILLFMIIYSVVNARKVSSQQPVLSFQVFYDQLSPYGQWVDYPNYGYVWVPDVETGFAPYSTGGHWIITEYGFTWVSDYSWGWAPFHYGRWDFDDYYGWFWIPDNEWGPAWVSWRRAEGYYGWEPMGPGITLNISFGRPYNSQNDHWIFVRDRDIDRSDINHYYINRNEHDRIARNSSVINNTYSDSKRNINYASGPAISEVQKSTGRRVSLVVIVENNKPGQSLTNGQLRMYRPEVIKNNNSGQRPAPARITEKQDVKRPSGRKVTDQQVTVNPQNSTRSQVKQNVVSQPNTNNNVKAVQTTNPKTNTRRQTQQSTVNPQNGNGNANSVKQQQVAKPVQNARKVKQPATVKTPVKKQTVRKEKSNSEQDIKKKE